MQLFRHPPLLIRWVLACFVLSLTSAVAAPLAGQRSMELVCSISAGMKLLIKDSNGEIQSHYTVMDCPLCHNLLAPPPPAIQPPATLDMSLGYVMRAIPAARIAALVAPPLPARGPPSCACV